MSELALDEWRTKARLSQEVEGLVQHLEGTGSTPASVKAVAHLSEALVSLDLPDSAKVRVSLRQAINASPGVVVCGASAETLLTGLDALRLVEFRLFGWSESMPFPPSQVALERLGHTPQGGKDKLSAILVPGDLARMSMAYLASKAEQYTVFKVPFPPGRYRLQPLPGEGKVLVPVTFTVEASGAVHVDGCTQVVVPIICDNRIDFQLDPPGFGVLAMRSERTGALYRGRGQDLPGVPVVEGMLAKFPSIPLDTYRVLEHVGSPEDHVELAGKRLAVCTTVVDSARLSAEGYLVARANDQGVATLRLGRAPSWLHWAGPAALVTIPAVIYAISRGVRVVW